MKPPTIPTPEQLAMLAATLAHGRTATAEELSKAALELWDESHRAIDAYQRKQARQLAEWKEVQQELDLEKTVMGYWEQRLSKVKSFPVDLEDFLKLTLPSLKGRPTDQMAIYRKYLAATAPDADVATMVAKHRHGWFTEEQFTGAAQAFLSWFADYQSRTIRAARSKAGKAGAVAKKKAKRRARPTHKKEFLDIVKARQLT
jgi:hypothetical protein